MLSVSFALLVVMQPIKAQQQLQVNSPPVKPISVGRNVLVSGAHDDLVHNEVLLSADPSHPNRLIGCSIAQDQERIDIPYKGLSLPALYGVAYISDDAGNTWRLATEFKRSDATSIDNHCAFGPDGTVFFVVAVTEGISAAPDAASNNEPQENSYLLTRRSTDGGNKWSDWVKAPRSAGTDREYMVVDDTRGKFRGRVYIIGQTSVRSSENESQGNAFTLWRSLNDGVTFEHPLKWLPAKAPGSFWPWNPAILSDGTLVMPYVDITGACNSDYRECPSTTPSSFPLKVDTSSDGGESLSASYKVTDILRTYFTPDSAVPYVLAVDRSDGPFRDRLYLTWAWKMNGRTMIFIVYSSDKGKSWSKPITVNDDLGRPESEGGPDDFMPTIAVNRRGIVGLTWYDRRDTLENKGYLVRFSASSDGGETWLPSVRVSEKPNTYLGGETTTISASIQQQKAKTAPGESRFGLTINKEEWIQGGHTAGLAADGNGTFHAVWVDNRTGIHQLWAAAVDVAGHAVKNGREELAHLDEVTDQATMEILSSRYDEKAQTVTVGVRIKNHSKTRLYGSLKVRVVELKSDFALPVIDNADNRLTGTGAVWDFTPLLANGALKPGESSEVKILRFRLVDVGPLDVKAVNKRQIHTLVSFEAKLLGLAEAPP